MRGLAGFVVTLLLALESGRFAHAKEDTAKPLEGASELQAIREETPAPSDSPLRATPEEFAEALQHIAAEGFFGAAAQETPAPTTQYPPQPHAGWGNPWRPHDWSRPVSPPLPQPALVRPAAIWEEGPRPLKDKKAMIRQVAFELDRLAHALETAEAYEQSDMLRQTAQGLRQSVRSTSDPAKEDL